MNRASQVMSAQTHASFLSAGEMLARSQQLADQTVAAAKDAYQRACEQGYRDGMERARRQATLDNVGISLGRRKDLERLEQDLNALVMQTLRQMLDEIDCGDRIGMLVRAALARLGKLRGEIAVHVHPDQAAEVASRLQQWNATQPEASLRVIADPALEADACRVACGSGYVEGRLTQQLAAIEAALSAPGDAALADEVKGVEGIEGIEGIEGVEEVEGAEEMQAC